VTYRFRERAVGTRQETNPIHPRNPRLILNGKGNLDFARHENGNKKAKRLAASTVSIRQAMNC
jgi:hypothetical protein